MSSRRVRILTWNIHGSYLYYLTQSKNCDFFIPVKSSPEAGYFPLSSDYPWGKNLHQIPAHKIKDLDLDLILFQSNYPSLKIYLEDQYQVLSEKQLSLPKIYLEHEPPRQHPTDTKHIVDDPKMLLVHVSNFNQLMWDNNKTPTKVIEHGVVKQDAKYKGYLNKGIVVINNLQSRGRRLGLDIFKEVRKTIPLELIGIRSEDLGGSGTIPNAKLVDYMSSFRFFFYPVRYTSFGLSICEAMMAGMPIIALATTEIPTVIENGISGYIDTDFNKLIPKMKMLLDDKALAIKLGKNAQKIAKERFGIKRFVSDWEKTFSEMIRKNLDHDIKIASQKSDVLISQSIDTDAPFLVEKL